MATAGELITGALRLIGELAEGEVPSAATSQDALTAMNQMIDSWSTERLSVYTTQTQSLSWPAGQRIRTLGPTGNFVGNRPILVDPATYFRDPATGISYDLMQVNQDQYNSIALKTVTSSYPQIIWVNPTFPDIEMYVYPVPTLPLEFNIVSVLELSQPATLATDLQVPPGYLRAFRYNLALEIAAEFGIEPMPQVKRIAMTAKRNIKRINNPDDLMQMPGAIVTQHSRYNIFTGMP